MDFNSLIDALIGSKDNSNLQMYVNDSSKSHSQDEYDCLDYLQNEFKNKMLSFKN